MIEDQVSHVLLAALLSGVTIAGVAALIVPPTRRLATRVRPYTVISRTSLGRAPDLTDPGASSVLGSGAFGRVFGPIVSSIAHRFGRLLDSGTETAMALKIRQAGMFRDAPEGQRVAEFRIRQLGAGALGSVTGFVAGQVFVMGTGVTLALAALGFIGGVGRYRGALESAIEDRRNRMRIEIYTVNQILAMHVRVGGGVVQAVQQVVGRGVGDVVDELAEALRLHRHGIPAAASFSRASRLTPEPACARTYMLLAAAEERGSDLAGALLALAEDVREARREAVKVNAAKRRAATLIPTIAILAPVLLIFVAAPLPSIIFGTF
ncbi:MAG: type II secretion system F family protein [Acidimicrobiia bacterium]|nr:type II secretion system F family protein [Acidimicrobiia bacterium]